jgi:hypothetical protein
MGDGSLFIADYRLGEVVWNQSMLLNANALWSRGIGTILNRLGTVPERECSGFVRAPSGGVASRLFRY